jgi:hypothetical protein
MHAIVHRTLVDSSNGYLVAHVSMWQSVGAKAAGVKPWVEDIHLHCNREKTQFVTDGRGFQKRVDNGRFEKPHEPDPLTGTEVDYVTEVVDRDMRQELTEVMQDYVDKAVARGTPPFNNAWPLPIPSVVDTRRVRPREVRDLDGTEQDFTR